MPRATRASCARRRWAFGPQPLKMWSRRYHERGGCFTSQGPQFTSLDPRVRTPATQPTHPDPWFRIPPGSLVSVLFDSQPSTGSPFEERGLGGRGGGQGRTSAWRPAGGRWVRRGLRHVAPCGDRGAQWRVEGGWMWPCPKHIAGPKKKRAVCEHRGGMGGCWREGLPFQHCLTPGANSSTR